jgi:hypothetical protein
VSDTKIDQGRVRELKGHLATKTAEIKGLSNAWKTEEGGGFVLSTEEHKSYLGAVAAADEIRSLIAAEEKVIGFQTYLDAPDGTPVAGSDAATTALRSLGSEHKSLGTRYVESDAYGAMKAKGFKSLTETFSVEGYDLADLSGKQIHGLTAGVVGGIPGLGSAQQVEMVTRTLRPNRVRDLFPSDRTNAAVLYGVRQTGFINRAKIVKQREQEDVLVVNPGANGAVGTPGVVRREVFGLKPKSDLTLTTVTYPISTIAHLLDVHKNVLDDEPRLRGILDRDMIDGIKMVEDFEILYGTGVGEDMTGIVNTPGVQTYNQSDNAADKKSAAIRRAATRAMLAYYQPTGVVMHPFDWEDIELEVDANGAYTVAVSVAVGGEKRVWRMEVVDTPAIVEGRFLLGGYGSGAKVYDREMVSVTVSTENRDNYERNVVTMRAEERIALEVSRPEAFVYGRFADAPA